MLQMKLNLNISFNFFSEYINEEDSMALQEQNLDNIKKNPHNIISAQVYLGTH